jgi:hypothetical protein
LRASHQLELDGGTNEQCGQDAGGDDLHRGLPRGATGIAPRFQQVAQLADVLRGAAVF